MNKQSDQLYKTLLLHQKHKQFDIIICLGFM